MSGEIVAALIFERWIKRFGRFPIELRRGKMSVHYGEVINLGDW